MEKHVNKFVLVWAMALTAFVVMGLTIPNNFTAGTTISSAEMNANFAAIKAAVDALEVQAASAGNIRGFARVNGNGTLLNSFMANGGTPTIMHVAASGIYDVTFPGEDVTTDGTNRCILANMQLAGAQGWTTVSGVNPAVRVRTYDDTGTLTDGHFWVMITGAP